MSNIIPQLIPTEYDTSKQKDIILTNITKMLAERKLVDKSNISDIAKKLIENRNDNDIYPVKLNNETELEIILLMSQKITSITKNSLIGEHIYKDKLKHKIIVVKEINPRSRQTVHDSFPKIEIFLEKELMFNLVDSIYACKYEILSKEEEESLLVEYDTKKSQLPYLLSDDPAARYYGLKVGQICRVIRASEITGYSNYYRTVVNRVIAKK